MSSWKEYHRDGGPVRLLLKGGENTLEQLGNTSSTMFNIASKEHRFWRRYPLPLSQRIDAWRNGFLSRGYVLLELDKHDPHNYVSDVQQARLKPAVNAGYADVLENKVAFHLATSSYVDTIPELYGTIESGAFITDEGDDAPLPRLLDRVGTVIAKPITGTGGTDVFRIESNPGTYRINSRDHTRVDLQERVAGWDDMLVVEFIDQHEYAELVWPASVNTIRIVTALDPDEEDLFVTSAVHRFGASGTGPTDNWSGGGVAAPVNVENGKMSPLFSYTTERGLERYDTHPDSGTQVAGNTIPQWDDITAAVRDVAQIHRQNPYVGWDVVLTRDGPRIIEGNCAPHSHLQQLGGGLFEDDRVRRFFDEFVT